jgi:hypothetical protein
MKPLRWQLPALVMTYSAYLKNVRDSILFADKEQISLRARPLNCGNYSIARV